MNSYYDILGYIGWAGDILIMIAQHSSERKIRTELMTENTWMEYSVCDERCDLPDCCDLSGTKYGTSRYSSVGHVKKPLSSQLNKYYGQYIFNTF